MFLALTLATLTSHAALVPGFLYEKHLKGNDDRGTFDISYLQISPKALPSDSARRPVNYAVAQIARQAICDADHAKRKDMESNLSMTAYIADPTALSIDVAQDYYCGGAYPDGGTSSHLFDLSTGKEVEVEKQFSEPAKFRFEVIQRVLANQGGGADGCDEVNNPEQLEGQAFNYSVRENSIVATQDFPHAMKACAFDTEIPYEAIKSLVKSGSLLSKIVK